jgi:hypothetical protein
MKKELYIASRIHPRESLSQQSPGKSEQSRKKRNLQHSERRLPPASQEQRIRLPGELRVHLFYRKMDTYHKKKGSKRGEDSSSCSPGISALKGEQEEACRYGGSILPRSSLSEEEWNLPPSPMMNLPRREKNLFSGNFTDE